MNAHALLTSQGWRGKGHSLHKTDDGIGLAKPLLLSRKDDTKGLGTKQHFTSDQWWMNAFDEQLKGLDTSKEGQVLQTVTTGKLNSIEKGSLGKYYLYTSFVRGGFLQGTIGEQQEDDSSSSPDDEEQAATTATQSQPRRETKEEKRARREARRIRKEERARRREARREQKAKSESSDDAEADLDKRQRRARREERRRKRQEKEAEKARRRGATSLQ
ncbi:hypothetical protein HIM_03181 [Hirsutella minnesotensis 3608]|nr:hypothetical protein HIM_03181 [Hirsutella minnesotensis 3608]